MRNAICLVSQARPYFFFGECDWKQGGGEFGDLSPHRLLQRGCKAVGPGGPGSCFLQALISRHCGKPLRNKTKQIMNRGKKKKESGPRD